MIYGASLGCIFMTILNAFQITLFMKNKKFQIQSNESDQGMYSEVFESVFKLIIISPARIYEQH